MPHCPKCRASLLPKELDGLPAQICADCGGLWLAREFVELWIERRREAKHATPRPLDLDRNPSKTTTLQCPDCTLGMDHLMAHGLLLEHCPRCRGVFFDRGELEAIARALTVDERTPDAGQSVQAAPPIAVKTPSAAGSVPRDDSLVGLVEDGLFVVLGLFFDG